MKDTSVKVVVMTGKKTGGYLNYEGAKMPIVNVRLRAFDIDGDTFYRRRVFRVRIFGLLAIYFKYRTRYQRISVEMGAFAEDDRYLRETMTKITAVNPGTLAPYPKFNAVAFLMRRCWFRKRYFAITEDRDGMFVMYNIPGDVVRVIK